MEPRKFINAFTITRHLSLSWASSSQSMPPYPTSLRFILILSSHLSLGLPSGLFPSGFPTKTLYTPLLSPIRATCPAHLILLDIITEQCFCPWSQKIIIDKYAWLMRLGASGGPVGWGIALQAGWSRVRFPIGRLNPYGRTMALGSTQPLTKMSTRGISWWVKAAGG